MSLRVLPRGADLVQAVAAEIGGPRPDHSRTLVVFPGRRPGHFLRKALATGDAGFRPPRIVSMDELVDELFDAAGPGRPRLESMDAVAILYDIQRSTPDPLGGDSFLSLDSFFPLGMRIARDLEDLLIEGVEPRQVGEVQELISQSVPAPTRGRLQTLRHFYERFYTEVEARGFSTRATRYRAVCLSGAAAGLSEYDTIVLAGFYALSASERAFFRTLAGMGRVRFLFQGGPGLAAKLSALGFAAPPAGPEPEAAEPQVRFTVSPDVHGQVFALNAALPAAEEGTVILLPAPESLFPVLRGCLSRLGEEKYNVSLGYPLTRTPVHGLLSSLMDLISSMDGERLYVPDYVRFILHPYTKNILFRGSAEATRVLFHTLQERLARSRTRKFLSLEEIESDAAVFEEAARAEAAAGVQADPEDLRLHLKGVHDATIRRFLSFSTVRDFSERCMDLVSYVHERSTAASHPFFTPFSEAFVRALRDVSRSLLAGMSFSDIGSYFTLFRRYLATRYFPFPGTPLRGLQVLGGLETRGLAFRRVIVLDANEGSLPELGAEESLLPFAVRAALGLPTYRDREEIAAYHFDTLLAGAAEVHLFFVESGAAERSRFVERLLWDWQKRERTLAEERAVKPVQYRVNLDNRAPSPIPKNGKMAEWLRGLSFSATSLDAYLACPLRFYYRTVLGLGRREEAGGEVERADLGRFVHEVLARYFQPRVGRTLGPGDIDPAGMEAIVAELFSTRYGTGEAGAGRLVRRQISAHLRDFLTGYLAGQVERGLTVRALEKDITTHWHGFVLRGRIDAVFERGGLPWLVDYKTGWKPERHGVRYEKLDPSDRRTWSEAIGSVQLPLYIILASAELERPPQEVSASVLLLGKRALDRDMEVRLFDEEHTPERELPRLTAVIDGLLGEIVDPGVAFAPALDRKSTCPYCDFTGLCGTQWLA